MLLRDDHQPIISTRTPIILDFRGIHEGVLLGTSELDEVDAEPIRSNPFVQLQMTVLRVFVKSSAFRA
jgi:hypothetical protein